MLKGNNVTVEEMAVMTIPEVAVAGMLIALALGLQIYLIYAIVATRQDVELIRDWAERDHAATGPTLSSDAAAIALRSDVAALREAAELRQNGALTDDEFARVKHQILSWMPSSPAAAFGFPPPPSRRAASPLPAPPSRRGRYSERPRPPLPRGSTEAVRYPAQPGT